MAFKPLSALRRAFGMLWRAVDVSRRTFMNLLFLLFVIIVISIMTSGGVKPIGEKTALVLELKGDLVEQYQSSLEDTVLDSIGGDSKRSVRLRDLLRVLDSAAKDKNIGTVVLLLDQLDGGGLAQLREVGAAIDRVKAAGKKVVAWGGTYDQKRYLIASHADEVYVHPMGMVLIEGFGARRNYYRDALDKLGVTVNLIKVGTYKSFAEPYIANGPSDAAREADSSCTTPCGRITRPRSRRTASSPPAAWRAGSRPCRSRWKRPGAARPRWRCAPSWWTASRPATRSATCWPSAAPGTSASNPSARSATTITWRATRPVPSALRWA